MVAGVLATLPGDCGCAQVTLEAAAHRDDRPLGVDRLDGARDELALFVARDEVVERIAFELFDPERNPLALDIDRQHLRLGLLALLEIAHRLLAGQRPGQVREVHQTVDSALKPDENAEVGDRLDLAFHLVALLEVHRELFPRIRQALLHPERSEEHTSELQSLAYLVCRLLLEKKKKTGETSFAIIRPHSARIL